MNKKLLILLIAAIVSVCVPGRMFAYIDGFKQTGYVLYLNSTEHETLELADPTLDGLVTFSSSDENVVKLNGKELIPMNPGEAIITAVYYKSTSPYTFKVGVKVIDSAHSCDLYTRVKSNDQIPGEGVMVSRFSSNYESEKYVMLCNKPGQVDYNVYGNNEILFFPSELENSAIHKFNNFNGEYKITNEGKYLQPDGSAIMSYGEDSPYTPATVKIDQSNFLDIYFTYYKTERVFFFDKNTHVFKFIKKNDYFCAGELYALKTVTFEKPDVDGVKAYIDGQVNSSDNIQLEGDNHTLTFEEIPEGAKLYYKFNSAGATQQTVTKEGTNSGWTCYVGEIPVNKSSGQIEYYTESHGLQSDHKVKTFTVPTGSNCIEIDTNDTDATMYFDLSGNRVNPTDLKPGIYIKRVGAKAEKVVI